MERSELSTSTPPFNTGRVQRRQSLKTVERASGDRVGFGGRRYKTTLLGESSFPDAFANYLDFISPRIEGARRLLAENGTLYFHIDPRESHYCKMLLDEIFGRECFLNEIVWAYDYGGRSKRKWPTKHDTILVYARSPDAHFFDQAAAESMEFTLPGVSREKHSRGRFSVGCLVAQHRGHQQ